MGLGHAMSNLRHSGGIPPLTNVCASIVTMAKILDVPTSGSIGGKTHGHNRAGQYIRNRRSPTQPIGTGRRAAQRNNFGAASSAWAALTFAQQAAWTAYANDHPVTDRLGQAIKLTGQQMFVSINAQLANCGSEISNVPPVATDVFGISDVVLNVTHAGVVSVVYTSTGGADDHMLIAFSQPVSSGRTFVSNFWQASVVAGNAASPQDMAAKYHAQFGIPAVGQRVFVKLTPVNQYGVTGVPVVAMGVVA